MRWRTPLVIAALSITILLSVLLTPVGAQLKYAALSLAQTFTAPQTFAPTSSVAVPGTTGAGFYIKRDADLAGTGTRMEIFDATPGITWGPLILMVRTTTPTIGDGAAFNLELFDSGGNGWTTGQMRAVATDVTDGSEDGYLGWWTTAAGTVAERLRLDQTGLMGPAGGALAMPAGATGASAGVLTLPAGASATGGNVSVIAGQRVHLEGAAGDTYTHRATATSSLESTIDGRRGWSLIGNVIQAPDCPADLSGEPPGICFDVATGEHVIVGGFRSFP